MSANEINQTFDLVSYVGTLVQLKKKSNYFAGACPMCGGLDRFTIKRGAGDVWHCRKCAPDGYHTPIDFIMAYHNIDFKEALKRMGGQGQQRRPLGLDQPVISPAPVQVAPTSDWQAAAWKQIDAANSRLMSEAGKPGRKYLVARGILRGSIFMHLLGYAVVYKRPAIVIPYLDVGEVVTAVKYRFIDELAKTDKGKRFAMMGRSLPYLFGLQHVLPSDNILLFVEGELNAISILQTLPRNVSIVSSGSESNGNAAILHALAARYDRVVIWMDDSTKAVLLRGRMGRDASLIQSPIIDHKKWDANEMLQAGLLADFVARQFSVTCEGIAAPTLFAVKAAA